MKTPSQTDNAPKQQRGLNALSALGATIAVAAMCGMTQCACEAITTWSTRFAVGVIGLAFTVFFGWRVGLLRVPTLIKPETAVVLFGLFALACVLATLTVQRTDFANYTEKEFRLIFERAEAEWLFRVCHLFEPKPRPSLTPEEQRYFHELARRFGADESPPFVNGVLDGFIKRTQDEVGD